MAQAGNLYTEWQDAIVELNRLKLLLVKAKEKGKKQDDLEGWWEISPNFLCVVNALASKNDS